MNGYIAFYKGKRLEVYARRSMKRRKRPLSSSRRKKVTMSQSSWPKKTANR